MISSYKKTITYCPILFNKIIKLKINYTKLVKEKGKPIIYCPILFEDIQKSDKINNKTEIN